MAGWGNIVTIAGNGMPGYAGDGGPAAKATVNAPFFCRFDRDGNLFFTDTDNNVIRRIDRRGTISTVAGSGRKGFEGDGGPALKAGFNNPVALAITEDGDLYIVDHLNLRVRKMDAKTGVITTVAGDGTKAYSGDGGPGEKASFKEPHDAVLDGRGGLLICDVADSRVRRLDLKTGVISTFAGTGQRRREGDGGPAVKASVAGSRALAVDPRNGDVYICEREGNTIRRVDGKTGIIASFAGTGQKGYTGDGGPATDATFNGPKGLFCGPDGSLFVVDTENHTIRRIDARTGVIATVAGGHKGSGGDGGPATAAGLNRPHGVCVAHTRERVPGALIIADSENHRLRRVEPAG